MLAAPQIRGLNNGRNKEERQGQKGAIPKTVCPKCEEGYLKTACGQEKKKMKRIGQYCPNPACDYLIKDFVELEDE